MCDPLLPEGRGVWARSCGTCILNPQVLGIGGGTHASQASLWQFSVWTSMEYVFAEWILQTPHCTKSECADREGTCSCWGVLRVPSVRLKSGSWCVPLEAFAHNCFLRKRWWSRSIFLKRAVVGTSVCFCCFALRYLTFGARTPIKYVASHRSPCFCRGELFSMKLEVPAPLLLATSCLIFMGKLLIVIAPKIFAARVISDAVTKQKSHLWVILCLYTSLCGYIRSSYFYKWNLNAPHSFKIWKKNPIVFRDVFYIKVSTFGFRVALLTCTFPITISVKKVLSGYI